VLLGSANFLFRVEVGDKPEGLSTLKPHELAARLSFALWGRGPSRELLAQAQKGDLGTREGLAQVVDSMLADVRTPESSRRFSNSGYASKSYARPPLNPPTGTTHCWARCARRPRACSMTSPSAKDKTSWPR
jgi:hypothetical protein